MYGSPMIRRFVPAASDFRALLELGIPIVIVQVGLMLMGVVDNIFVGHVSGSMLAHYGWYLVNVVMFPVVAVAAAMLAWYTLQHRPRAA